MFFREQSYMESVVTFLQDVVPQVSPFSLLFLFMGYNLVVSTQTNDLFSLMVSWYRHFNITWLNSQEFYSLSK